jgi:hypothetical protein
MLANIYNQYYFTKTMLCVCGTGFGNAQSYVGKQFGSMIKKTQKIDMTKPLWRVVAVARHALKRSGEAHFRCVDANSMHDDALTFEYFPCKALQSVSRSRKYKFVDDRNRNRNRKKELKRKRYKG